MPATMPGPVILGMGNPLLDISAHVGTDVFEKYGLKMGNAILAEDKHMPLYKELVEKYKVDYIAGGATLNSMRVAQWCLQDQPDSTAYIGCIGKDDFGETMQKCLKKDGVSAHFRIDDETPTGTCAVVIHEKERSLVANLAAANKYSIDHLKTKQMQEVVSSAKLYYVAGFFITVSVPSILAVGEHAAEQNKIFCMNLSAPFIVEFFGEKLHECLPYVDFLFANETEAAAYGKTNNVEDKSIEGFAKHIAGLPKKNSKPRTVVFTQGSGKTIVVTANTVQSFEVEKLDESKIVDLNGAGDAMVGGFISRLIAGKSIAECVKAGHAAARYIIQQSGCSFVGKPDF